MKRFGISLLISSISLLAPSVLIAQGNGNACDDNDSSWSGLTPT